MDYQSFVDENRTFLIAPAGYGKTYTIVECLKYTSGKQLILTHTHAGIASIKEKIRNSGIESSSYNVETISSFAQKYTLAYYCGTEMPEQEDEERYHPFAVQTATDLFKLDVIKSVLSSTYSGVFIDEYQDCSQSQHLMIMELSQILPTHILGDPLQGIFGFNETPVDLNTELSDFQAFPPLNIPQRWQREGNAELGEALVDIRDKLENNTPIDLRNYSSVNIRSIPHNHSLYSGVNDYTRAVATEIRRTTYDSLLVLVPQYFEIIPTGRILRGDIRSRTKILPQIDFSNSLFLVEAIDDRSFYTIANRIDEVKTSINRSRKPINKIKKNVLESLFKKTGINRFFGDEKLIEKRNANEKVVSEFIKERIEKFIDTTSLVEMRNLLVYLRDCPFFKFGRIQLVYSCIRALETAMTEEISVYEAMKKQRNIIRRSGRKISGKCMGTTLLTKGLEFDAVIVLDAHRFDCPKHLYVALTRASKSLTIFTSNSVLDPFSSE